MGLLADDQGARAQPLVANRLRATARATRVALVTRNGPREQQLRGPGTEVSTNLLDAPGSLLPVLRGFVATSEERSHHGTDVQKGAGGGGLMALRLVEPGEMPVTDDEAMDELAVALNRYVSLGCPGGMPDMSAMALRMLQQTITRIQNRRPA